MGRKQRGWDKIMVREINKTELNELLELYLYLHEDSIRK